VGVAGPRGVKGATGQRGTTGTRGATGAAPHVRRETLLNDVNGHLDEIFAELTVQMKRMAQIQRQVDELRAKLKRLAEAPA
jgi:hypothetical protein